MKYFSYILDRVQQNRVELEAIQMAILNGTGSEVNVQQENVLTIKLMDIIRDEEVFMRQKSKITWLKEGDNNTHLFHKAVSVKQRSQAFDNV